MGVDFFDLSHSLGFIPASTESPGTTDALDAYLTKYFTHSMRQDMKKEIVVVQLWYRNAETFPSSTHVTYHLLATQPSSAPGERDFSHLAHIINRSKERSTSRLVPYLIHFRSDQIVPD